MNAKTASLAGARRVIAMLTLCGLAHGAAAAPAHEHGVAHLDIVIEGSKLLIHLDSPLDNLAGFEHAPRNDQQRSTLRKMEAALREGAALFKPDAAAACLLTDVRIAAPFADGRQAKGGHADLEADWTFSCAKPEALQKMEVHLAELFLRIHRLKVTMATPKGQSSTVLSRSARSITF